MLRRSLESAWIKPQPVEIVGVFIAAGDGEDAGTQDIWQRMDDPVRIAIVGDYSGELVSDAQPALRLSEEHHAAVRGDPSAIEGGAEPLACDRWQMEGQRDIFIHRYFQLLDRCAASARGIMPDLHRSDYVRLIARADEVIQ